MLLWMSAGIGYNAGEAPAMAGPFPGLQDTAGGDSLYQITGLAQLVLIALLAFPIWLFGLLIGVLLPKGFTESRAASAASSVQASSIADVADLDDLASTASSIHAANISSRPLSDDEIASSSDEDDDTQHSSATSTAPPYKSYISGILGRFSKLSADHDSSHTVSWAQQIAQLLGSKPLHHDVQDHKVAALDTPFAAVAAAPAGPVGSPFSSGVSFSDHAKQRQQQPAGAAVGAQHRQSKHSSGSMAGVDSHRWYVSQTDWDKFNTTLKPVEDKLLTGNIGHGWTLIMDKEVAGVLRYLSYWRPTENGSTDYLSVTIMADATAQEIHEYNLDDVGRSGWDPMLKSTWLLGSRDLTADEQLVVWLRSFPMGFLSDRLYAGIARRTFTDPAQPNCVWGASKVVHTPTTAAWAAEHFPGVTQTDNYYSAWRCRTISSPWPDSASSNSLGSSGSSSPPACELILLHHDELKVPEYLSRMAVKVGMWKFLQGMVDAAGTWLEQRRTRIDPFTPDPAAACRQPAPPLTGAAAAAAAETAFTPRHPAAADISARIARRSSKGAGDMSIDAGSLLSPRRLYAVPTAPDLLSLTGDSDVAVGLDVGNHAGAGRDDSEPLITASAVAANPHAAVAGLRRGFSMAWEPKPDSEVVQGDSDMPAVELRAPSFVSHSAATSRSRSRDRSPIGELVHVDLPPINTDKAAIARTLRTQTAPQQQHQQQQGFNLARAIHGLPGSLHNTVAGLLGEVRRRAGGIVRVGGREDAPVDAAVGNAIKGGVQTDHPSVVGFRDSTDGRDAVLARVNRSSIEANDAVAGERGRRDQDRPRALKFADKQQIMQPSGQDSAAGERTAGGLAAQQTVRRDETSASLRGSSSSNKAGLVANVRKRMVKGAALAAGLAIGGLLADVPLMHKLAAQRHRRKVDE